ncbi:RNA polymerase sigma factor [Marivita sp. S0852]|uniref:RNA polymerase sigma factor n=1 Tax=Marivita sp. S0852 TaxID=3373893 RepID=UPI003981D66A
MTHLPRLHARARRLTHSSADAEDLCHDACVALLEREANGARIERPLPYMMTALRHAASARLKLASRQDVLEDDDHPQSDDASLACFCTEVLAHLDTLPQTDRALLRRVAFEEITPSELAKELNIPVGTIMSRLARARARLRDAVGITSAF